MVTILGIVGSIVGLVVAAFKISNHLRVTRERRVRKQMDRFLKRAFSESRNVRSAASSLEIPMALSSRVERDAAFFLWKEGRAWLDGDVCWISVERYPQLT